MNNFLGSWKSTLSSICTVLLVIGGAAISYFASQPVQSPTTLKIVSALSAAVGIAKIVLGMITQDADKVTATIPSGEVKSVPAHTVPDNPADVPVVPPAKAPGGGS